MIFNIMGGKEGWHVKDLLRAAESLGVKAHVTDFRLISHSLAQPSKQALEEAGYKCEIWVFNKKGEKVECY